MDPIVKANWVDALRSGDFTQGTGVLHRVYDDGQHTFCCLGVLCELAVAADVRVDRVLDTGRYLYDGSNLQLPPSVATWSQLDSGDPRILGERLSILNDGMANEGPRNTFAQLADMIEEYL